MMLEAAYAQSSEIGSEYRKRLESWAGFNAMIYQEMRRLKVLAINESVGYQFIKLTGDFNPDDFTSPSTKRR